MSVVEDIRSTGISVITVLVVGIIVMVLLYVIEPFFWKTKATVGIYFELSNAIETAFELFSLLILVLVLALVIVILMRNMGLDIFRAQ